ncbi:hypothetical protein [Yoonia sp. BS5-3]|uniref:Uncharacterized protein n=1 Tax=Yoonia phaeophyticola TaxID=3137369 RepID=A0ABZ2V592_9RHOB
MSWRDTYIKQSFRTRRAAGGLLVFIALPITLIWLRFGLPLAWEFDDLLFVLGGPGLLLTGLWAAFPQASPQIRMIIGDEIVKIYVGQAEHIVKLCDLQQITKTRPLTSKSDRLAFETADGSVVFDVIQLTHEADDILNLISIRLEGQGRHLHQVRTDVLGAPSGIWTVAQGNPFERDA